MKDLTVAQQEQSVSEEQRIAKAVAEQEAKQAQEWWEEEERQAAMLRSIREHRELSVPMRRHAMSGKHSSRQDRKVLFVLKIRDKRRSRDSEQQSRRQRMNLKPRERPTGYLKRSSDQRLFRSKRTESIYKPSTPHRR